MRRTQLKITGMTCASCVARVEKAIREIKAGKYRTHHQLKDELGF